MAAPARLIAATSKLEIRDFADVAREVDAAPARKFMFRPVWPAATYGVLSAESKAQKTWDLLDAAVSVATKTPWLGVFDCEQSGPVLLFLGEGGRDHMVRCIRAIATARGITHDDLPIRLCFRVPHLTKPDRLAEIRSELERYPASLLGLDPLYLAARRAETSKLVEMGELLEEVQHIAADSATSLLVVHHHNRKDGRGHSRMGGAGPAEWGRVLISVHVDQRRREPDGTSNVVRSLDFVGSEIPDTTIRIRRRIRSENPDDLASPLHYETTPLEDDGGPADNGDRRLRPSSRWVQRVLQAADYTLTVEEIGDRLANDGRPLKRRTIQASLADLEAAQLAKRVGQTTTHAGQWTAVSGDEREGAEHGV